MTRRCRHAPRAGDRGRLPRPPPSPPNRRGSPGRPRTGPASRGTRRTQPRGSGAGSYWHELPSRCPDVARTGGQDRRPWARPASRHGNGVPRCPHEAPRQHPHAPRTGDPAPDRPPPEPCREETPEGCRPRGPRTRVRDRLRRPPPSGVSERLPAARVARSTGPHRPRPRPQSRRQRSGRGAQPASRADACRRAPSTWGHAAPAPHCGQPDGSRTGHRSPRGVRHRRSRPRRTVRRGPARPGRPGHGRWCATARPPPRR